MLLLAATVALVEAVEEQTIVEVTEHQAKEITVALVAEHFLQAVVVEVQAQSEIIQPQLVVETVVMERHRL
jgi:uncharacterized Fe-S center protein